VLETAMQLSADGKGFADGSKWDRVLLRGEGAE
jgi:hypothetical protein